MKAEVIRGVKSAIARATLVVDKMGFMFEANHVRDSKQGEILELAKKLFADDNDDGLEIAKAEGKISPRNYVMGLALTSSRTDQIHIETPAGVPTLGQRYMGRKTLGKCG